MSGSGRITLNDVAAAGGASRATVSFVLNDVPHQTISAATRDRVRQAARDLGYDPHGVARALREGSSRVVVLDRGLEGNCSRSYVCGLDEELAAHGHVLLVRHGRHSAEATRQVLDVITPRAVIRRPGGDRLRRHRVRRAEHAVPHHRAHRRGGARQAGRAHRAGTGRGGAGADAGPDHRAGLGVSIVRDPV
jgi:hypothetical protein